MSATAGPAKKKPAAPIRRESRRMSLEQKLKIRLASSDFCSPQANRDLDRRAHGYQIDQGKAD